MSDDKKRESDARPHERDEKPRESREEREERERKEQGVSSTLKASSALGVLAAIVLALLVNVAVARRYKRWDFTSAQLYTLSEPTKTTLRGLSETVQINVLLSSSDGLSTSVRHLLTAYGAETDKLDVRYLDPDRNPAEFMAFQQRYGLLAGRTEDGRVVADASIVVVKGDKRWFLTPNDLVDVSESDEGRSRPKLEQGITMAIRNVLGGERQRICFARGHGELGTDEPGARGLGELKHRLDRNNVDVSVIDVTATDAPKDPWKGCALVYVAGPQTPWAERDAEKLATYLTSGGNVILFVNAMPDGDKRRLVPSGLETVASKGGIELRSDLVFEKEKAHRIPQGMGETFLGQAKPHPITTALVEERTPGTRLLFLLAQSLGRIPGSTVVPAELVVTSPEAYAVTDFLLWKDEAPQDKRPGDRDGPLAVAMAAELPKPPGSTEPRGPRIVVIGSSSITQGQVWQEPALRAGAYFVESAVSWLTTRPQIVDIPAKPAVTAGMRLTEESAAQVRNYVIGYIPIAAALVGLAVFLRRRSTERRRDAVDRRKGA